MTLLPPTIALLLCLLVATSLGAGIGACLWHLRLSRRHDRSLQRLHRSGAREREALGAILAQEREASALKHEQQARRLRQEHERAELAVARADELARRENVQARRIERLEAERAALDERLSALRRRRTDADRRLFGAGQHHSFGEELPVLRRRVGGATPSPGNGMATLGDELVDGELEIPALAESELPDSVDDLLLELLDTGCASAAVAYDDADARIDDADAADPDVTGRGAQSTVGARDER